MCDLDKIDQLEDEMQKRFARIIMLEDAVKTDKEKAHVFMKERAYQLELLDKVKQKLWVLKNKCMFFRLFSNKR
jgi:hypothetical protein